MKIALWTAVLPLSFLAACATHARLHGPEGLAAESVELQVDEDGNALQIEYHVDPSVVPAAVRAAMDELHPGGRAIGAEKEYVGATLYWEVTKEIGGREVEAMFQPDGTLHSEELAVSASAVPPAVQAAVAKRMSAEVAQWEEIRDESRTLVEYHAKLSTGGKKYKLRVSPGGEILGVVREVPAEIEMPVEPR